MPRRYETQQIPTQPDDRAATIIVLDRDERRVATLGGRGSPVYEAIFRDAENEAISLTFRTKSDTEEAAHLKQRNFVAVEDPWEPGVFRLLEIVEVDQVSEEGESQLEVVCEDQALIELSGDYVDDIRLFGTTPDDALTRILGAAESRWKVGTVNLTGDGHTNIYHESVAEGLEKLSEAWGGIFRFRVTVDGSRITGRYIDWLDPSRWEDFTGVRWETGKNLKNMKKTVISSDVATAIYPYGRGEELENEDADPDADPAYGRRINIEEVEWSKENGDPVDKPKGQKWIGDPEALQRWGYRNGNGDLRHIFHVEIFEDEEDPENLAKLGWEKLQTLTQEWATYEAEVVDRSRDPKYAHETTRLGTAGILIDDNFNPPVEVKARVIGAEVNLNNKRDLKITLGSFIPGVLDSVRRVEREVEKKVGRGDPITLLDTTVKNLKDRLRSSVGYKYESETLGTLWSNGPYGDPETDSYLQIKGGIMAIADRWDPVANEPDWRAFGTGAGFSADLITAGTLNAELINVESVSEEGDRLIRMTDGSLNTYLNGNLTLRVGGYGMFVYDDDTRHPNPKYDPAGIFSLNWSRAPGDPPEISSERGVGIGTFKDHIIFSQVEWDGSGELLKDKWTGLTLRFTRGEASIGFDRTYFGRTGSARINAAPYTGGESGEPQSAIRIHADNELYMFMSRKEIKDTWYGQYHFRMPIYDGKNWKDDIVFRISLSKNGKGAYVEFRSPITGEMKALHADMNGQRPESE